MLVAAFISIIVFPFFSFPFLMMMDDGACSVGGTELFCRGRLPSCPQEKLSLSPGIFQPISGRTVILQ